MKNKEAVWFKLSVELLQQEDLSLSAKVVYAYMLWRWNFFVQENNGSYFEAQETIAEVCKLSRKTVNESIRSLCAKGWMTSKKNKAQTSSYEVKDRLGLYSKKKNCASILDESGPF